MKNQYFILSLCLALIKAEESIGIPELDNIIRGSKLIGSIPEYINKTNDAFSIFES